MDTIEIVGSICIPIWVILEARSMYLMKRQDADQAAQWKRINEMASQEYVDKAESRLEDRIKDLKEDWNKAETKIIDRIKDLIDVVKEKK